MDNRQRLLAILDGRSPDRIPWIPRLLLWYNARTLSGTMPHEWEGLTLRQVEAALGVGTAARNGRVFETHLDGIEIIERIEGERVITEYRTPVGDVRSVLRQTADLRAQGLPGRVEEHLLKQPADYAVWEWVVTHTRYEPTYDAYRTYDTEIGGDGLPMVSAGDVPLHEFLQHLAGYESGLYQLADYPREVEHLLMTMLEAQRDGLWPVLAESPARLLLHGVHLSSQFTPPRLFRQHITPYYLQFMPMMHQAGMHVAMHADNDTSAILELVEEAGWDMVECFVTAPMVPLTLARAREVWGHRVIIWGGIPSLMLSPSVPEADFKAYIHEVLEVIAPGDAFILGVADNVMPDSLIHRVAWVTQLLEERGGYPLT
jgi:hypothetical protein